MSECRTVGIEFPESNEQILIEALKEMGYKPEVHKEAIELKTYYGKKKIKAHIVIRKNQFGGYMDVGFERKDGKYDIHLDSMDTRKFKLNKIKQHFFIASIKKHMEGKSKFSLRKTEQKGEKVKLYIDVNY